MKLFIRHCKRVSEKFEKRLLKLVTNLSLPPLLELIMLRQVYENIECIFASFALKLLVPNKLLFIGTWTIQTGNRDVKQA